MNLFKRFEVLEDPRDIRGKKYKLIDVLIMTIYAILCGQEEIINKIVSKGGHYVLKVKDNQKELKKDKKNILINKIIYMVI